MNRLAFILSAILATQIINEVVFDRLNLYYELPWLDIPMHIWGGFLFGVLFCVFTVVTKQRFLFGGSCEKNSDKVNFACFREQIKSGHEKIKNEISTKVLFLNILFFVICIGVAWEIYEYLLGLAHIKVWGGWFDTIKDLFDDSIGAYIAYRIYKKEILNSSL
jgi:Na+/glutamate symporter